MSRDWWKTFFDEEIGNFMFGRITSKQTIEEVRTILQNTRLRPAHQILDLACGRGRHSLELAKRGFHVTGLDFSKRYIQEAFRLAKKQKVNDLCTFLRGDMRNLRTQFPASTFDLVISLYNSFGYFSYKNDDQKVLREIHSVLKTGGLLVLNTLNHHGVENKLCAVPHKSGLKSLDRWEKLSRSSFFLDRANYDVKRKKLDVNWHFIDLKSGQSNSYSFQQNVYTHIELRKMLRKNGFSVVKTWGMLEGGKFTKNSWHQTILAKKL